MSTQDRVAAWAWLLLFLILPAWNNDGGSAARAEPLLEWNASLHRCVYTQSGVLSICNSTCAFAGPHNGTDATCVTNKARWENHCGLVWKGHPSLSEFGVDPGTLEAIPEVHLIGDSTLLRLYMHLTNASAEDFVTKVAKLEVDEISSNVSNVRGRNVTVYFHRSLHIALAPVVVARVIASSAPRALVVVAYGPHDTSWLVFRRAMPFFRNVNVGKYAEAAKYWKRWSMSLVKAIADALLMRPPGERPIFLSREHFIANCRHPKYSKYPLLTRCNDLLNPTVIPFYRRTFGALLAAINVPTVSIDGVFPPCMLIDAGHVSRSCKSIEWQFIVQAYHLIQRSRVVQGGSSEPYVKAALWQIIGSDAVAAEVIANVSVPPSAVDRSWVDSLPAPTHIPAPVNSLPSSTAVEAGHDALRRMARLDRGERILVAFGVLVLAIVLLYTTRQPVRLPSI